MSTSYPDGFRAVLALSNGSGILPWEMLIEGEEIDGLQCCSVIKQPDGAMQMVANEGGRVLWTCQRRGEEMLRFSRAPGEGEPDLDAVAAQLCRGVGSTDAFESSEDLMLARLHALRVAARVGRALGEAMEPGADLASLAWSLIAVAGDYGKARDAVFEAENCSKRSGNQSLMRKLEQAVEDSVTAASDLGKVLGQVTPYTLKLSSDPRGAPMQLTIASRCAADVVIGDVSLSWLALAEQSASAKGPRKRTRAADEVREVLAQARIEGRVVKLPQVDAKLYAKVKKFLASLGGSWNRQTLTHVFDRDAAEVLQRAAAGQSVQTTRDWEYFPTPAPLVRRMLTIAQLKPGMLVLEPHGGRGAIASAAAAVVGMENVRCVEAMPANAQYLREEGFSVQECDFLEVEPQPIFDVVLANPPFANGADTKHIRHASRFLKPGAKLVAYSSPTWDSRSTEQAREFREWLDQLGANVQVIPAGAFAESGTQIETRLIELRVPQLQAFSTATTRRLPQLEQQPLDLFELA